MRPAMQRQAHAHHGAVAGRQQQAIGAKILETQPIAPQKIEQRPEAAMPQQLPGQQMVALHTRIIAGHARAVDRTEGQRIARPGPGFGQGSADQCARFAGVGVGVSGRRAESLSPRRVGDGKDPSACSPYS
jgi:hypothetical protein